MSPAERSVPAGPPGRNGVLGVLVAIATVLLVVVGWPIAGALFAGAVVAVALYPLQRRALRAWPGRDAVNAGAVTLLAVVFVGGPLATVAALALREVADEAVTMARRYDEGGVDAMFERLPRSARPIVRRAAEWLAWSRSAEPGAAATTAAAVPADQPSGAGGATASRSFSGRPLPLPAGGAAGASQPAALEQLAGNAASSAAAVAGWLTRKVVTLLLDLVIMVLATFCLLAWGTRLVAWIEAMLPLPRPQTERLVRDLRDTVRGVLLATFVTAVVQTIVACAGYLLAGVASLPLAAASTFVGALIPVLGAAVVTCAIAVLQLLLGETGSALFLFAWGVTVVNLTENVLVPWLSSGRAHMPSSVLLFAILGGIAMFGTLGIVAGPLIVAFFRSVVEIANGREAAVAVATVAPGAQG
jgi:predicted PurR-regulated permease PerM